MDLRAAVSTKGFPSASVNLSPKTVLCKPAFPTLSEPRERFLPPIPERGRLPLCNPNRSSFGYPNLQRNLRASVTSALGKLANTTSEDVNKTCITDGRSQI